MRRMKKAVISLVSTLAMLASTCAFAVGVTSPPSGPPGGSGETTVTYDYVEFGSYPQTEIVSQASDAGVYDRAWGTEDDYIIDAKLYGKLVNAEWDANGDTTIDNIKYRRLKKSDATGSKTSDSETTGDSDSESTGSKPTEEDTYTMYYNWSSAATYHYFRYEPIKWRILQQDGGEYFLLSEMVLDGQKYNEQIPQTTWVNSSLRSWLNGYDSTKNLYEIDCTSKNFINTAFTSEEQSKIVATTLKNKVNIDNVIQADDDTSDKIYILSDDQLYGDSATAYGFASSGDTRDTARQTKSSTYAKAMGVKSVDSGCCYWWVRAPGSYPGIMVYVRTTGSVDTGGKHANSKSRGVRPAMRVVLDDVSDSSCYASLTLKDNIDINFSMKELGDDFDAKKLSITVDGNSWTDYTVNDKVLTGVLKAVEPKDIGTPLHIVITYDGFPLKDFEYSVTDYCEMVFKEKADDDAAEKTGQYDELASLCEAILNYGKYAEDYANGNTDSTVNTGHVINFTDYEVGKSTATTTLGNYAGEGSGAYLTLGSTIKLNFVFKKCTKDLSTGYDENGNVDKDNPQNFFVLNDKATPEQIDPKRVKVTTDGDDTLVSIDLYASQLSTSYTLKLKEVDASEFCVTYGVYDYCAIAQITEDPEFTDTVKTLCKAIHNYSVAVQAYISTKK